MIRPFTLSIVAFDPKANELSIAVESKFLSVGAVVPWVQAGIGAIATQPLASTLVAAISSAWSDVANALCNTLPAA